jgi:hypothetical protein
MKHRWIIPMRSVRRSKARTRHAGRTYTQLTLWLPARVETSKGPAILDPDFSTIVKSLRDAGRGFIVRENARKQQAIFVEVTAD